MIKPLAILVLSLFLFAPSLAITLEGIVYDSSNNEPLPGVNIVAVKDDNSNFGAATDITGRFELSGLPLSYGKAQLRIHLIGYEDKIISLDELSDLRNLRIFLKPSLWKMDKVVVTATRRDYLLKDVPVTTELVLPSEYNNTGALTVDEALESHIGVDISDDLSGKGVTLRGVDPSRVLVLVDGNRVIGRVYGSLDMAQLPLANVEQIEIVKGAGSTLYGSDAIGGVINIITQKPSAFNQLDLYSSYGSFNTYDFQSRFNTNKIGKGSNWSAKYEHTDGFDLIDSTEHTNGLERTNRFNINNKTTLGIRPGWDVEFSGGLMLEEKDWIESDLPADSINYDDNEKNRRYDLGARTRWSIKDKANFTFNLHGSYYDHDWRKFDRDGELTDESNTVDDIYEASFQYSRRLAVRHIFTFGGDLFRQGLDSDQLASGNESVISGDFYMQHEWRPMDQVVIMPGLRWDRHETYGSHLNPSLSTMWELSNSFNLRGSISRGFRAPSIKELYFEFDHSAAGVKVIGGGEDLEPETSVNYSVTGELKYGGKAVHRITYFRNEMKNLIDLGPGDFSDPRYYRGIYTYENVLKAKTEGVEWETEIKMISNLDLSFSYTHLNAKDLTNDHDLVNRPTNTFKFYSNYDIKKYSSGVSFWGFWNDHKLWEAATDAPNSASQYAPSRWNLSAGVRKNLMKNLEMSFRVQNLTDETNAEFAYWPERSYTVNVSYHY